jgi:signal transduction histidine kinase/AmiR/NasT family two-component response regulator
MSLLGHDPHEPTPPTRTAFAQLVHPEDRAAAAVEMDRHFRSETPMYEHEIRMRHSDGRWVWILERGRVWRRMFDGSPVMMSGTHMDVTARKLAAEALEVAMRRAEEATRAKSNFLATMSHEIRTPMNGVLGMAALLDRQIEDPKQRAMLAVIQQSGEMLLNIINDVLDLSKIESGRLDFEAVPFAPGDLARQIAAAQGPKAAAQGLDLRISVDADAERLRRGDPHRLMQVLHNLVGNAVKFTEAGSVTVAVSAEPDGALAFEISDTGIGMTEDTLAHVFEPFVQADSSTTRRYGGTGLGMTIVRRIVEGMGGAVSIESRPGEGTRVRVVAPLPCVESCAATVAITATPSVGCIAGLRVLAADDNDTNRMVLKAMLDALGVAATMVESGAQAVAAADDETYDVILLDITMPGMDGCATLAQIRASERAHRRCAVPAVAVTANALQEHTSAYLAAGFMGHLPKPLSLAALETQLRAAATPHADVADTALQEAQPQRQ